MSIRSTLTVLALTAALLAGCGSEDEPTPTGAAETSAPAESTDPTETSEPTASPEDETEQAPGAEMAAAFRSFARGGAVPPMADEVMLYLGNALTGVVTPGLAADRQFWGTCTETGSYAGRSCPISPLTVLKKHREVEALKASKSDCLRRYGALPPDLKLRQRVALVPAAGTTNGCGDDFAVLLFTNTEGQLVAVSTLLGGR